MNSFTTPQIRGSGNDKTSNATVTASPNAVIHGGEVAIVVLATDNSATTAGATNTHSLTDSTGANAWTKDAEYTQTAGAIRDGVTLSLWRCKLDRRLTPSDTITGSVSGFASGTIAKAMVFTRTVVPPAFDLNPAQIAHQQASTTTPSATVSGLSSAPRLYIGAQGAEGTSSYDDADYTTFGNNNSSGSTAATNVAAKGEGRLLAGTGDTYNGTFAGAIDTVTILAAYDLVEVGLQYASDPLMLLGATIYQPGSDEIKAITNTSGAPADATNLSVSFVAPASGEVMVHLEGYGYLSSTGVTQGCWGLRPSGGSDVFAPVRMMGVTADTVHDSLWRRVTGLTPGDTYTWEWILKPTSSTMNLAVGPGYGPGIMEVFELPSGVLLGETVYAPATPNDYTYSSSVPADIDATNLALSFTTPASGKVALILDGVSGSGAAGQCWLVRDGSGVLQAWNIRIGAGGDRRTQIVWYLVGLPPSTAMTWRWGWFRHAGSNPIDMPVGAESPAIMQAWALT